MTDKKPSRMLTHLFCVKVLQKETVDAAGVYLELFHFLSKARQFLIHDQPITIYWVPLITLKHGYESCNTYNDEIVDLHTEMLIQTFMRKRGCSVAHLLLRRVNAASKLSIMRR